MKFAENNRISHRQLYRQMILALLAPFLLCLYGKGKINGPDGMAGTAAALILLLFYVIFLVRLAPVCADLKKSAGGIGGRAVGVFFLIYILFSGAFLLALLEEIVPVSLVTGISGRWLTLFAVVVCAMGTHRGMQRRGRMAEVSGGLLLWGILLMMALCVSQGEVSGLRTMAADAGLTRNGFLRDFYGILCAFSGISLLPFALRDVEKQSGAGKTVIFGVLTLGGIVLGMQVLLPAVLGWGRLQAEEFPVLPLLAGADLPGNILARFDVLWMGFLLYSLLFSIGSLLHYGNQVARQAGIGSGRYWVAAVMYGLSFWKFDGMGIRDYYGVFLGYVFVPALVVVQILLMLGRTGKRRKRTAAVAAALSVCVLFSGCAGVEPEKRMYPLALGADGTAEGFRLTYAMADLSKATGQQKPTEGENAGSLTVGGESFEEIEALYDRTQEKYLDLGHLQILVLGESLRADGRSSQLLKYLKQEPLVGEDVYVFRAADARELLAWKGKDGTSAGEYIQGIMENRINGRKREGVTLRDLYRERYESGKLPDIPELRLENEEIEVLFE